MVLSIAVFRLLSGDSFLPALSAYHREWVGNASLFLVVQKVTTWIGASQHAHSLSLLLGGVAALSVLLTRKASSLSERADTIAVAFVVFFLFSPVVYPWYLLWILPFAALARRWSVVGWTGLVACGYGWYLRFAPAPWLAVIEYAGFGLVLLTEFLLVRARSRPTPSSKG